MKRYIKSAIIPMDDQLSEMWYGEIDTLAADPRTSPRDLWNIYKFVKGNNDSNIRNGCQMTLAKNPAIPDDLLSTLIADTDHPGVQLSLLFNPRLPEADAARIVRYHEWLLNNWVGGKNTDPLFLRRVLAYCEEPNILRKAKRALQKQGIDP